MGISYRNREGYADPTAFEAISNIERGEKPRTKRLKYRPLVYVCSPLAGDLGTNIRAARKYSRFAVDQGCLPITPHLLYPQFLDDSKPEEREAGMEMGLILLGKCAQLWVFGKKISTGMREEIEAAKSKGIPIRYFTEKMEEQNGTHF